MNLVKDAFQQNYLTNREFDNKGDSAGRIFAETLIRPIMIWRILTALQYWLHYLKPNFISTKLINVSGSTIIVCLYQSFFKEFTELDQVWT